MKKGELVHQLPNLDEIKQFYMSNIERIPKKFKDLDNYYNVEVKISKKLKQLTNSLKNQFS